LLDARDASEKLEDKGVEQEFELSSTFDDELEVLELELKKE